jgi:MFS transporter, DHA1 family, inner membrane transport protein
MKPFSERPLLLLLAAVQFTHIMDFMIMMPLGPQLMRDLSVSPGQFSSLVAAYSITAGIVGLMFAPFIDRFDRRPLLLIAYAGFAVGTLACALSTTFRSLLIARAICGGFGGVSGALVLAIVSDLVPPERRATGMGIIMTAFFMTVGLAVVVWLFLAFGLPSVSGHMGQGGGSRKSFMELITNANANRALLFMGTLIFGHFAIIPLLSAYLVSNVGVAEKHIFLVYLAGGSMRCW